MSKTEEVVPAHPEGEAQSAGNQRPEPVIRLDTFAGKIHVKWSPEATVSSLGLMPFFIEFLKSSGLFDKWVEDCPLRYRSGNAPEKALHGIARQTRHANQTTIEITSTHAKASHMAEILTKVSGFLKRIKATAEQLTLADRWKLILSAAFRSFLGGKIIGSTGRLADAIV